jgi:hypothetical protein
MNALLKNASLQTNEARVLKANFLNFVLLKYDFSVVKS